MKKAKTTDLWQLAEIHGAWYSLLLKVDVLAASNDELTPAQELLSNGLEVLEDTLADLQKPTHESRTAKKKWPPLVTDEEWKEILKNGKAVKT